MVINNTNSVSTLAGVDALTQEEIDLIEEINPNIDIDN